MAEGRQYCETCGSEVRESANFCPNCGAAQSPDPQVQDSPPSPIPETDRISTPDVSDVLPPPPEKRRNALRSFLIVLACVVLLIYLIVLLSSGRGGTSAGNKQTSSRTFTSADYAELATDPAAFKGASVDVVGRLLKNPEVKGAETSFQMFADPKNSEWNTIVHTDAPPSGLSRGDEVRVQGTVRGSREGKNAFGGTVKAVEVDATSVDTTKTKGSRGVGGATVSKPGGAVVSQR